MNDLELRNLIREIAGSRLAALAAADASPRSDTQMAPEAADDCREHPSHHVYLTLATTSEACLIEPAVPCSHCGYCKCHGY